MIKSRFTKNKSAQSKDTEIENSSSHQDPPAAEGSQKTAPPSLNSNSHETNEKTYETEPLSKTQNELLSSLQASLEEKTNAVEQWKKDYLYLKAEFDNYKKQSIKERNDLIKFGPERLALSLLDVLDTFERALETAKNDTNFESFIQGIEMTYQNIKSLLKTFHIEEIPCLGQAFDPSLHEALSVQETDEFTAGHICALFKKPYRFHDKIIRPAQVVVAKEKKPNENEIQPENKE